MILDQSVENSNQDKFFLVHQQLSSLKVCVLQLDENVRNWLVWVALVTQAVDGAKRYLNEIIVHVMLPHVRGIRIDVLFIDQSQNVDFGYVLIANLAFFQTLLILDRRVGFQIWLKVQLRILYNQCAFHLI